MIVAAGHTVILTGGDHGLEPVRKSHFAVEIHNHKGNQPQPQGNIQFLVKSFDPPALAVEVKTVRFTNHIKTYPGERTSIEGSPLVLRCMSKGPEKSVSLEFFQEWFRDAVYDYQTDTVSLVGDQNVAYITLKPLRVDMQSFAEVKLLKVWPSSIKLDPVDADNDGDVLDFTVTFQCSDIVYEFK